jgi:ATP-dependent Clp protease ATP-binding subunit ClpC
MPDDYTSSETLLSVVMHAMQEADALRHDHVGTGHLLLAILRDDAGPATRILNTLGVDRDATRSRALDALEPGDQTQPMGERPYTQRAVRALQEMMKRAMARGDSVLDADDLLISLVSIEDSLAARALADSGVTAEAVVREAQRFRDDEDRTRE